MTHNSTLVALMRQLLVRLSIARSEYLRSPHDEAKLADIHETTARAVASGDPSRIEARVWEQENGRKMVRQIPEFLARTSPAPRDTGRRSASGRRRSTA